MEEKVIYITFIYCIHTSQDLYILVEGIESVVG